MFGDGALTPAQAYRRMALIRRFEERALELSAAGRIPGPIHPCVGQEAVPVGAVAALEPGDRVIATYRGHGWALACGTDPAGLLAEILQRAEGINGGRAGSPFLSDPDTGFLGENSIVGAGVPISAGVALAATVQDSGRVVVTSFGDGAFNQGATTEGLIFAAMQKLPVVFICENNGWSEMTPIAATVHLPDLAQRGVGLGIDSSVVDGNDPFAIRDAVLEAVHRCRQGHGPVLIEAKTTRLRGHSSRDIEHYRPKEDLATARARDPLRLMIENGRLDETAADEVDDEIATLIESITSGLDATTDPDPATATHHVYGPPASERVEHSAPPRELTYQRALNVALREELSARPQLLVYGEDVGHPGGVFGVSRSLQKDFGANRVFDTPISEAAILGSAVGAGLEGVPTVVEIMWADFALVALDQVINQAANVRYVNRSRLSVPMTIRMQQGVTPGSCAQHSQSLEALFAHIPGLKVGLPATAQDAYSMLRAAVADPDPTVVIEHRSLYQQQGEVVTGGAQELAEGARLRRSGGDVAIVTWGAIMHDVLAAADQLAAEGVDATVLDLRWLRPIDDEAIGQVVHQAGGRVLIVHEAVTTGGFGAEIAARIAERHYASLTAPVRRIGAAEVRIPASPTLQRAVLPSVERIVAAAQELAISLPA